MLVLIEDRLQAPKAFPSIAGAKIRINPVTTKFRHVIRSDFRQTYDLKVSLKNKLYVLWGASLCFRGIEAVFSLYKSAYYKVITNLQERVQYSVFSFFRCC